jgi:fatty-acyl-CoA synthase
VGLREDDVVLCSVPFSYMNGGGSPQMNLLVGATSVCAARLDPEVLLDLVAGENVTVWTTAPAALLRLMEQPRLALRLRLVLVGGAPITPAVVKDAEERLGAHVVSVYGLTETSPYISAAFAPPGVRGPERHALQATAGRPIPGVEVRVVDEAGRDVPRDAEAVGEILVRGHGMMTGYHRDPDATARSLRGGWLHTGDLASWDERAYLTLRGRTTDEVVVGGMRVSAGEIEAALASHPDVARCSVVASPDPERGEAPVAIVVRRAGALVTEADLHAHAAGRLARFKLPRRIEFVDTLPVTEAGEVVKSELRTLYTS